MNNNISIKEAAQMMGISQMLLRLMIRENKLGNIGFCIKNKSKYSYYINRKMLELYLNEPEKICNI